MQEPQNDLTRLLTGMRQLNDDLKANPALANALGEQVRREVEGPAPRTPEELDAAWARERSGEGEVAGDGSSVSPPEGPGAPGAAARANTTREARVFGFKTKERPGGSGAIEFDQIEYIDIQNGVVVVDGRSFKLTEAEVGHLGSFAIQVMARELTRSILDLAKRAGVTLPAPAAAVPPNETEATSGDGADTVVPPVPEAP